MEVLGKLRGGVGVMAGCGGVVERIPLATPYSNAPDWNRAECRQRRTMKDVLHLPSRRLREMQAQGTMQAYLVAQTAITNMQQRNAAAADLNTTVFVQSQHATHDMSATSESKTWQTCLSTP